MNIFTRTQNLDQNPNHLNPRDNIYRENYHRIKAGCKSVRLQKPKQETKPKQDKPDNMNQKKCLARKRRAPATANLTSP